MSNIDVVLTVNILPLEGYTATTASNGNVYYYKYSGGNSGNDDGSVIEYTDDGSGQGTITVTLTGTSYNISSITFSGDTSSDLSYQAGSTNQIAIITDSKIDNESAYYSVICSDPQANCTFACDPGITNKPKPN